MLVREVVSQNDQAAFQNDVQLGWYPSDPLNSALARGYMFTSNAVEGKKSSVEILDMVRLSFLVPNGNRHIVIATYGHGKTHLALALANYFGKPAESIEVQCILDNIAHSAGEPKAATFHDFKQGHAPYLVIRVRGDKTESIYQQVISGLETALKEHDETREVALPFWFEPAERFLANLTADQAVAANQWLQDRNKPFDVPTLLDRVKRRDASTYDICREISRKLYNSPLDFGHEVSLERVIAWVTDELCGDQKPLSGVLVLFDELSAFVQRYADGRNETYAYLQDLLDGITNTRTKAAFVAFSQHDPDQVADHAFRRLNDRAGLDSLKKELNRLPPTHRYNLFTSMEMVLDAYLKQDGPAWDHLYNEGADALDTATDYTQMLFGQRYDDSQGWTTEKVANVITRGCFPLHPLATALLCSVDFREVLEPRGVLGFVLKSVKEKADQSAITNGVPNWVYATELVDWFSDMLADEEYEQYRTTVSQVGPDITQVEHDVLKAMLLAMVGQIQSRGIGYAQVMANLSGHPVGECEAALKSLFHGGYIRHDPYQKTYGFYVSGGGNRKLEKWLTDQIGKLDWDNLLVSKVNPQWQRNDRLRDIPIACEWGHQSDYAANQLIISRSKCTVADLRKHAARFTVDVQKGLFDGKRGVLLWLIAETDDDIEWYRANAERILDEALRDDEYPLPFILAIPDEPSSGLRTYVMKELALADIPAHLFTDFGAQTVSDARARVKSEVDEELKRLKASPSFRVPNRYRLIVAAEKPKKPETVLACCYREAYRLAPPAFFQQFAMNRTNLRHAVHQMCSLLAQNKLSNVEDAVQAQPVARELLSRYIRVGGPGSWGMMTVNNALQVPTANHMRKAWEQLDDAIKPGGEVVHLRSLLMPYLNPPYGFDYNHLALLLCAWYGYNRHDLTLHEGAKPVAIEEYLGRFDKGARDFIAATCFTADLRVARCDRDAVAQEMSALIEKVNREEYSEAEAKKYFLMLQEFVRNEHNDPEVIKAANNAIERLKADLDKLAKYVKDAKDIRDTINQTSNISTLILQAKHITSLPSLGNVTAPDEFATGVLRKKTLGLLSQAVSSSCDRLANLGKIEDYTDRQRQLTKIKTELSALGEQGLCEQADQALSKLEERRKVLDDHNRDRELIAVLTQVRTDLSLLGLREKAQQLQEMKPCTEKAAGLLNDKIAAVENVISSKVGFVQKLSSRADMVSSVQDVRDLEKDIQTRLRSYLDSPEYAELDKVLARVGALEACFRELKDLGSSDLRTPANIQEVLAKIEDLGQRTASHISVQQQKLFEQARMAVQENADKKRRTAIAWLEQQEARVGRPSEAASALKALDAVPAFLPSDCAGRLAAAREKAQQVLDADAYEREAKQKDAPIVAAVNVMSAKDGLSQLRANLDLLTGYVPLREETRVLITNKEKSLNDAQDQLLSGLQRIVCRVEEVSSLHAARQLSNELIAVQGKYLETPEYEHVDRARTRVVALEKWFEALSGIERQDLKSPSDVRDALEQLTQSALGISLSDAQRTCLSSIEEHINKIEREKTSNAIKWLDDLISQSGDISRADRILRDLNDPPRFLPATHLARVEELKCDIAARLDANHIEAVKAQFRRITDKARREVCLAALRALMQEMDTV